jgi:hypothetical protein
MKVVCNDLVRHSTLNHTHRSLTVILTSHGIDVLVKILIFRMASCLLLLTAQLMTAGDLNG